MWCFHQKFNLSAHQRRVVMAVILTMVSTATRVQAAAASGTVMDIPTVNAYEQEADDVPLSRGLVVPPAELGHLKEKAPQKPATQSIIVPVTAFTSDPRETDSTPFITANGTRVHDGTIAANFLKLGTRVRMPDHFGEKIFIVEDRMNARYDRRIDIWMSRKADAYKWGVRRVRIEILP